MEAEKATNLLRMNLGAAPSDRAGQFTFKIFPDVHQFSAPEVKRRAASRKQRGPSKWITRAEIPVGAAGWFTSQARTLLAGIEHHTVWDERYFVGFTDFDTRDDGSLLVPDRPASNADISQSKEEHVLRWMRSTMTATLHSAFACELALKAIALTCKDETKKT